MRKKECSRCINFGYNHTHCYTLLECKKHGFAVDLNNSCKDFVVEPKLLQKEADKDRKKANEKELKKRVGFK